MHSIFIYLKSFIDFIILLIIRFFVKQNKKNLHNLLFINTGQIGDLVISSSLLKVDEIFSGYKNIFFLILREYSGLFKDYKGKIQLITIDIKLYKYNLLYRIKLNQQLRKKNIDKVYNLTSVRPTWNDTLALGIGANSTYCFANNWQKIKKVYLKKIDIFYSYRFEKDLYNEYDKIDFLIREFGNNIKNTFTKKEVFKYDDSVIKYDIIIAPFSTLTPKEWGINKFTKLVEILSNNWKVLLLGSKSQNERLNKIKGENDNVIVAPGNIPLNKIPTYLNKTDLFIGLDSGIAHLSIKLNTNSIILIGGGTYGMYLPKPYDSKTIYLTNKLPCFNCNWHCNLESNLCLSEIKVNDVLGYVKKILLNENH